MVWGHPWVIHLSLAIHRRLGPLGAYIVSNHLLGMWIIVDPQGMEGYGSQSIYM